MSTTPLGSAADQPPGNFSAAPDALCYALRYAAEGIPIIWIPRGSRAPKVKDWPKLATRAAAVIERWAREHPGCNFGLVMGHGYVTIDVDDVTVIREGKIPPLPETRVHTTPSVGLHFVYAVPEGTVLACGNAVGLFPHVDIRTIGGQVVCPGSIAEAKPEGSGIWKTYTLVRDLPIAPLPDTWLQAMNKPPQKAAKVNGKGLIPPGDQDVRLFKLAAAMQRQGASETAKIAALREEIKRFEQRPGHPWTEEDLRRIARSAGKYPPLEDDPAIEGESAVQHSEDALALLFSERFGQDLRYTAKWGQWSVWDGKVWREDTTLAVFDRVRKLNREVSGACPSRGKAGRLSSAQTVAAVERLARSDRRHAATVDQWNSDPWLLNTPGGVIDLKTGELRPAERDDYMTKITGAAPGGDCPRWLAFLERITNGDQNLIAYLQRIAGYCLTGSIREHALFFLHGTGGNGKSTFLETIAAILGDYAITAPMETFVDCPHEQHPTALARLQGARMVTAVETEEGRRWSEAKIKALTGGDRIPARFMHKDFFDYVPQFKVIIAGNHRPSLRTVDPAISGRFHLVPFTVTIPIAERDGDLKEKLREEWPGILAWAVEGCLTWQTNQLSDPTTVSEATTEYLTNQDVFAQWLDERCEAKSYAITDELWKDWCWWSEFNRVSTNSKNWLSSKLIDHGFEPFKFQGKRSFRGLTLRQR